MPNVRWKCPKCNRGVNAPTRMRTDDIRRYCLPCSQATGRLMARRSAVLERKRIRSRKKSTAKAKRRRAVERKRTAPERRQRAQERKAQMAARQELREQRKRRDALTHCVYDVTTHEMGERGYVEIGPSEAARFFDSGVVVSENSINTRFVPLWAHAIVLHLRPASAHKAVKWLQSAPDARAAVQTAAVRSWGDAIRVAQNLWPFPDRLL